MSENKEDSGDLETRAIIEVHENVIHQPENETYYVFVTYQDNGGTTGSPTNEAEFQAALNMASKLVRKQVEAYERQGIHPIHRIKNGKNKV